MERRVFGPMPSQRLGKSLGVNNIPHKICTYSCLYCQVGKAIKMQVNRQEFYKPQVLVDEVKAVLCNIQNNDEYPDYITIVPDGEPTLDIHLGELINQLKTIKIPIAVITNASLIQFPDVQNDLLKADYVSVKADTFNIENWHKINKHHTAYILIPTRPPAFKEAIPADEATVNEAYNIFKEHIDRVELLTGYEGNAFSSTGNFGEDILNITAVHPMCEDAVLELLHKTNGNKDILYLLMEEYLLEKLQYSGHNYYLRKFKR